VLPGSTPALAAGGPPSAFTIEDPRITESSGLAASRLHPGVYWTHNDSGDGPYVYAVDGRTGRTVATVTMRGIGRPRDAEAISIGPDGDIYVGDIGDNLGGAWPNVWIYRFPEPKQLRNMTVDATQFTVTDADGPRNAEALMVQPRTGRVYIASKNEDGGGLYEGPAHLSASGVNTFHRIAGIDLWITDGAFSPDGTRLVLRGYFSARMYRWVHGKPEDDGALTVPIQPQGESVTFTPDGRTLMYGSEGERSEVTPETLSGDQLPASVAEADRRRGGSSGQASGGGAGATAGQQTGGEKNHNLAVAALTFAAATVLWLGGRRLFRRRG
jgi:hypothetical protein